MTKILISKSELLNRLQSVSKIISSKPALPIMSTFLFDVADGRLNISAADSSGSISTSIENVSSSADISICLDAKNLLDALKTLTEQPVTFEINPDNFHTTIKYSGGKFKLIGTPSDAFPKEKVISDATIVEMPIDAFIGGISKTSFCAADDELRPIMNAVFVEIGNGLLTHVATDGHFLALNEHRDDSLQKNISFALPQKAASILKNILPVSDDTIKLSIGYNTVRFEYKSYCIVAQLLEGRFPNYRSVIPQNNDKIMSVDTVAIKGALSRVLVFVNQSSRLIKLDLNFGMLKLTGQDVDFSTHADEEIACEYQEPALSIGFNGTKLQALISAISAQCVTMTFSDLMRATLITPSDNNDTDKLTYLLMPMALGE